MKKLFLSLLVVSNVSFANETVFKVRGVSDGDTIKVLLPLPYPLNNASVRIKYIDTPEKGALAKCDAERSKSAEATAKTKELLGSSTEITVKDFSWDKYGGRIDGVVFVNGINIGDELVKSNLAVPYFGGARRSWCK